MSLLKDRNSNARTEYIFKVLVIGEIGSGKTSFIKRYVHQFYSQTYRATIGVDFALKVMNWDESTVIRLQLWDIAGQERFGSMTRVYYRDAAAAFVVFDLSRIATFEAAAKWKADLDEKVISPDGKPVPVFLIANKCDMTREEGMASDEEIATFAKEHGFLGWGLVSAKEGIGVEDVGRRLVAGIMEREENAIRMCNPIKYINLIRATPTTDAETKKKSSGCGCN